MSDAVVVNGDTLQFSLQFGNRTVTVAGVPTISGSGQFSIEGKPVCVLGDEQQVVVNASYVAGSFIGGVGSIRIKALSSDQQAAQVSSGGQALLLKGRTFIATFTPNPASPAKDPSSGATDATVPTDGTGSFMPGQTLMYAQ